MNPNHDEKGKFTSGGAATGDHQKSQSAPRAPGRQPLRRHAGVRSLGTDGGSGPAGSFGIRLKPKQQTTGLRLAAREKAEMGREVDRRHYPEGGDAQRLAKRRVLGI